MSGSPMCCQPVSQISCIRSRRPLVPTKGSARICASKPQAKTQDQAVIQPAAEAKSASQRLALFAAVVPLLVPLQAHCQEQAVFGRTGGVSPEVVGLVSSSLAIPVVVFGAVSLIQQAKQAQEDTALRLKAINTHNTFLSQEEDQVEQPEPSVSIEAAAPSGGDRSSIENDPDAAAPAMLDQPERPEPRLLQASNDSSSDIHADEQKESKLPPQTAVLDRPNRPEPETASRDADVVTRSDATATMFQPQASAASSAAFQTTPRPHSSPDTIHQVAALQTGHEARVKGLRGVRDNKPPSSQQRNHTGQASDMAAEYAAKLALLHEESAARADIDRRKRRERYIMLADLQAQAKMTRPASPAKIPEQPKQNVVAIFFLAVWARIMSFCRQLVLHVQNSMGAGHQSAHLRSSSEYSSS